MFYDGIIYTNEKKLLKNYSAGFMPSDVGYLNNQSLSQIKNIKQHHIQPKICRFDGIDDGLDILNR